MKKAVWQAKTNDNIGFLTANKRGDYVSFFKENLSRYQGWFVRNDNNLFKIIESISLTDQEKVLEVKNEFWRFVRKIKTKKGAVEESFFLPKNNRGLVYETSQAASFDLFLDFKQIFNNNEAERFYKIEIKGKTVIIECSNKQEKIFLAIKTSSAHILKKEQWVKRFYNLDQQRNSPPFERFVLWALQIRCTKAVFAVGDSPKKAIEEANLIFKKTWKLKKEKRKELKKSIDWAKLRNQKLAMAYYCAQNSLGELIFKENGQEYVEAGLPWFFNVYSRDELISLKAISQKQSHVAWRICLEMLSLIGENGQLPNKLNEGISQNADGTGWLFKRIGEQLENKKMNELTVWKIKKYLEKSLQGLVKSSTNKELALCFGADTWMDSIDRPGERIEIQALRLYMFKLAFELTKKSQYRILEAGLKFKVKEKFWNNNFLFDGSNDQTIRPNAFLAAYVYPELLTKKEWQNCFDNILPALWLDWGGLATIDKTSPYFNPFHTGEKPQSYHSGDSWFYLNNLAALVLYKTNPERYKQYINKILEASATEILTMGAISCHAELSSANQLLSQGCFSQAWSSAMFVELIKEIYSTRRT
ncbi:MAG: amylo-alpha-1,6-glucosidase [Candidatus Pacebacteria bacterium]|nr:amylo-alpha-1,6-glucosidase [Candidatus Paceibacterota bacterium]